MEKKDKNLNNTFNTSQNNDFNNYFNLAVKMCEENYQHEELIKYLKNGEIFEKQISALKLEYLLSVDDAGVLLSNLTNQNGKVREAVALKFTEFVKNPDFINYFYTEKFYPMILKALVDVNGNVSRLILDIFSVMKNERSFLDYMVQNLPEKINFTFAELNKFEFNDKQHVVNKAIFRLYWYLEGLYEIFKSVDIPVLRPILIRCAEFEDYTIREKIAKFLTQSYFDLDKELQTLKEKLKNDKNYYVRRCLN